jgi:hypothetical protein
MYYHGLICAKVKNFNLAALRANQIYGLEVLIGLVFLKGIYCSYNLFQ